MKTNILKSFTLSLCALLLIPVVAYCTGIPKNKTQDQFVQFSQSAVITQSSPARLIMSKPDVKTLWFTDRPQRKAGWVKTANFVKGFSQYFLTGVDTANPNATLVANDARGQRVIAVLTLSKPVFNASANTLSYKIENIYSQRKLGRMGKLNKVVLFIDAGVCIPWDNC